MEKRKVEEGIGSIGKRKCEDSLTVIGYRYGIDRTNMHKFTTKITVKIVFPLVKEIVKLYFSPIFVSCRRTK